MSDCHGTSISGVAWGGCDGCEPVSNRAASDGEGVGWIGCVFGGLCGTARSDAGGGDTSGFVAIAGGVFASSVEGGFPIAVAPISGRSVPGSSTGGDALGSEIAGVLFGP